MKPKIITTFLILIASFQVSGRETHPSLFNVEIGRPFDHPGALENKDANRPMTQFRVPNYGPTSGIFPEYQISLLNSSNAVSIVTAETVFENIQSCMNKKGNVTELLKTAFPKHSPTAQDKSNLGGNNEFSAPDVNTYYVLQCQQSYGPFWTLHLQFRGVNEDKELKSAWNNFFNR